MFTCTLPVLLKNGMLKDLYHRFTWQLICSSKTSIYTHKRL